MCCFAASACRDRYKIIHNVKAETIRVALDYIVYTDINGNVLKLSHNISDENVDTLVKYILTKSHTKDVVGVDVSKIIESEPLKYSTEVLRITSCNDTPFMKFSYWEAFMFYFCFFMQFMILSLISNNSDAVVVPCDSFGLAMVRFFIAAYVSIMLPRSMNMMIKRKFLTLNKSWSSHFKMVLRYILFLAECVISFIVSCIDRDWERVYAAQVGIFDFLINLLTLVTSIQLTLREGTVLPSLFTFTGFLLIGELDDLFGEMMKLDYTVRYV